MPFRGRRLKRWKRRHNTHIPRFILVSALREELEIPVPEDREPGRPWKPGPPVEATPAEPAAKPIGIEYARCSAAQQELAGQLDVLARAKCKRVFSEKISTQVKTRPKLEEALKLAYDIREAAPDQEVILTVHELKRLACNAAELMTLSGQLQGAGVQLELLTGPLTGVYDPNGMGAMFFASSRPPPRSSATTSGRRPWKARSRPPPRATTAGDRRSSTTTPFSSPARSRTRASPSPRSRRS
ncbi:MULTISPECIES: recombinase family protein [unclassified Streptomyces]|uniref:recombinase family protein n=1 Tax=unclassified Streptomyces TaxID=2593676 RepID=UPI001F544239|nr:MULTISPECIES: recombinase family protein [unclassified Streptomyces]